MWLHLKKIKNKIIPYQRDLEISLLIGSHCLKAIKPREAICGNGSNPYGLCTILGWGTIGPIDQPQDVNSPDRESNVSFCNRIVTREVGSSKINHFSFILDPQIREKICPAMVNNFFQQDFSEQSSNHYGLSSEDQRFLAITEKGIEVVVRLESSWKGDRTLFPVCKHGSMKRKDERKEQRESAT